MRALKLGLILSVLVATFALPVLSMHQAYAIDENAKNAACEGIGLEEGADCNQQADDDVNDLIAAAVNILSWVVGVAAVFMIIIGGFKYVTAQGDTNAIASAKTTLIYAIIGLIVAALAQAIVQFVLKETT